MTLTPLELCYFHKKKSDLNSPRSVPFFKKRNSDWKKEDDLTPLKMGCILVLIWIHFKWTANQHLKENCSIDELKRDSQICNTRGSTHNSWHNMSQRRAAIICAISSIFFFPRGKFLIRLNSIQFALKSIEGSCNIYIHNSCFSHSENA